MEALKAVEQEIGDNEVPIEAVKEFIEEAVNPTAISEPVEEVQEEVVGEISDETIVQSLVEELHKKFEWEVNKEQLSKFKTLDDFYKFIGDTIEFNVQQARPKQPEVQLLEKFLNEGKSVEDFYKEVASNYIDVSRLDAKNEEHANYLIYRFLKAQGSSDKVIEKLLGSVEDEQERTELATEALQFFDNKNKQYLQQRESQEKQLEQQRQQQLAEAERNFKLMVENFDYKRLGIQIDEAKKQYIIDNVVTGDPNKQSTYDKMLAKDPTLRLNEIIFTLIYGSDFNKIAEAGALTKLKEAAKKTPQTTTGIKLTSLAQKQSATAAQKTTQDLQAKLAQLQKQQVV